MPSQKKYHTYTRILTARKKYLLEVVRRKYGIVLDEGPYLKNRTLSFYKLGDASKKEIWRFNSWDEIYDICYLVTEERPSDDWLGIGKVLDIANRI